MVPPPPSGAYSFLLATNRQYSANFGNRLYFYAFCTRTDHVHILHFSKLLRFHYICFLFKSKFENATNGLRNFTYITSITYKNAQIFIKPCARTWRLSRLFGTPQKSILHITIFPSRFLPFFPFLTPLLINVTPCILFWRPRPAPPH